MSFRTPSTIQNRQTLLDLGRTKERLAQNSTRISSGKRLTSPGDDPAAAALILDFGNSIQANTQFIKQADSALGFLKTSEDVVSAAVDHNMRLQELAQQGLAASNTAASRAAIVAEVDGIRANLLALANTKEQGKYIFAGTQTQTVPFTDGAPPAPPTWNGSAGAINLDVTASTSVATNVSGDSVFLGAGGPPNASIFQAIQDLRDGLTGNSATQIQTAIDHLSTALDHLTQIRTDLGGRQAGLLALQGNLSGFNLTLQDLQNAQQDTDYPQAVTEYTNDTTIQSATLSAMAKANKANLFDYLG